MGRVKDHDLHPQDEWDDDEDDVAPLVALVNRTNNDFNGSSRMKSFDEVMVSRGRKGRQQTWRSRSFCWLALQTGVAVVTLGCPIVIYLLYFNSGPPSGLTNTCNSASVQELMERMTEASNLCDSDVSTRPGLFPFRVTAQLLLLRMVLVYWRLQMSKSLGASASPAR
jgi:hypothetical protein